MRASLGWISGSDPGLLPLAVALSVVWDMACHSHKADVCMNCQKETETTLWEVERRVRKEKKKKK